VFRQQDGRGRRELSPRRSSRSASVSWAVPVSIGIPIGAGSPKDSDRPFEGVIDLIAMKAMYFDADDMGRRSASRTPRGHGRGGTGVAREALRPPLTEKDDKDVLTTAFLEGREIPAETVRALIREQTLARIIQPVLCGSGREQSASSRYSTR